MFNKIFSFLVFMLVVAASFAQITVNVQEVASGLNIPVDICFDPDNNMYVVEKGGKIKRINYNSGQHEEVLNLTDRVNAGANERGLLGLAFHPDYKNNGYVYVNYTGSGGHTRISRFKRPDNQSYTIDKNSEKILMTVNQPFNNHNAGDLNFGVDGYLYIAMGDGGSGGDPLNKSQDPKDRLGKMLRIDINTEAENYIIPTDNPFVNSTDTLKEIWALGLRNPWRFSFDQLTHDLWIADVGQNRWEELNFTPASSTGGENYGWRCYEADQKFDFSNCNENTTFTYPIHKYQTLGSGEGCSITGGFVVRDSSQNQLFGKYIYGDFCTGNIWSIFKNIDGSYTNQKIHKINPQELSTFGQDNNGGIYFASMGNGTIFKLTQKCQLSASISNIQGATCAEVADGSAELTIVGSDNYSIVLNGSPNFDNTALAPGNYVFTISDTDNACTATAAFEIPVKDSFNVGIENELFVFCDGDSMQNFTLNATVDSVYVYLNGQLMEIDMAVDFPTNNEGTYGLVLFSNGCDFVYENLFTVQIVEDLAQPEIMVSNDTLFFSGNFGSYELFFNGVSIAVVPNNFYVIDPTQFGSYQVVGMDGASGCNSEISLPLVISSTNDIKTNDLRLYPNPTNGSLQVKEGNTPLENIVIYDMTSKRVKSFDNESHFDLSDLLPGQYWIMSFRSGKKYSAKIILQK